MASYQFSNKPIPKHLPVFNEGIYQDIINKGEKGFQGSIGIGFQGFQGFEGLQGVQGLQGLASPLIDNLYIFGVQGIQSSFTYQGAQTVQTEVLNVSGNLNTDRIAPLASSSTALSLTTTGALNLSGQRLNFANGTSGAILCGGSSMTMVTAGQSIFHINGLTQTVGVRTTNPTYNLHVNGTLYGQNNYGIGYQGVQGSFGYLGCQTLQGQQGYFNTSMYSPNNYGIGYQGVQGSFGYLGCNTIKASSLSTNENLNCSVSTPANSTNVSVNPFITFPSAGVYMLFISECSGTSSSTPSLIDNLTKLFIVICSTDPNQPAQVVTLFNPTNGFFSISNISQLSIGITVSVGSFTYRGFYQKLF